jgi:hypothetical protein
MSALVPSGIGRITLEPDWSVMTDIKAIIKLLGFSLLSLSSPLLPTFLFRVDHLDGIMSADIKGRHHRRRSRRHSFCKVGQQNLHERRGHHSEKLTIS